ncbi:MAG: hypothetical protein A3H96_26655 [Acidobacteria bacterium RIFCSPLOWO2_02_FULL_67_36]|nr:MAG: hypothetical protein A3H96_26655 [Acidobacteria bacterium RIFCSPLOWO2_02_FULL_67_36]OFW18505.1 MAG: hypothetical protein A3G21_08395 [Acidobacteria bacterium RIFCSPLOWO2_12_FULL_66_21]
MRDTDYATLISEVVLPLEDGEEARLERIRVKALGQEEIRLSWWKNGNIVPRPLDLSEDALWKLIAKGITDGVLCRP